MKSFAILFCAVSSVPFSVAFSPSPAFATVRLATPTTTHALGDGFRGLLGRKQQEESVSVMEPEINLESKTVAVDEVKQGEELSETKKLMKQVKEAGTAGIISYALWELGFWFLSVPVCILGYREVTGHFPDLSNKEDLEKLGAEAFAFVNFARFAVPLRIGLALSTTPWIQKNIVDRFFNKENELAVEAASEPVQPEMNVEEFMDKSIN